MKAGEQEQKRLALQKEINSNPTNIDRSCFKKTLEEKRNLEYLKSKFKNQ